MGVEDIVKSVADVVTLGAVSRKEQSDARADARKAQREIELEELRKRKEAAERDPDEETATLSLLAMDRSKAIDKGDLLIDADKSKTQLGRAKGTGLGFNV